jgi:hypothetical protein
MPTFTSIPTTAADLIREAVPYEEYLADLLVEDRVQAKAHLVAILSAMVEDHAESVLVLRAGLPPEQIRQAYLENLFPDEDSAAAYLWALKPGNDDSRILEIEGEKEAVPPRKDGETLLDPSIRGRCLLLPSIAIPHSLPVKEHNLRVRATGVPRPIRLAAMPECNVSSGRLHSGRSERCMALTPHERS